MSSFFQLASLWTPCPHVWGRGLKLKLKSLLCEIGAFFLSLCKEIELGVPQVLPYYLWYLPSVF